MVAPTLTHNPVLLERAIDALVVDPAGTYVDGTFGGGGHSRHLLDSFPQATVVAFDRDPAAVERARAMIDSGYSGRLEIHHGSFVDLGKLETNRFAGILLDLGFSSYQIDDPNRGFALRQNGPLDMRFDPDNGLSAAELLATLDETELADLIWRYGEERRSRSIARAIVARRSSDPILSTAQLADLVAAIVGRSSGHGHPATRTFQALRIAVNNELGELDAALAAVPNVLRDGGRLVVIAFHSLEDRAVKRWIAAASTSCICPPDQPICTCGTVPTMKRVGGAIKPSAGEEESNPRSRSAIMRVAERLPHQSGTTP